MAEQLLIFPCNGNGLEAVDCLAGHHNLVGFIDDTPAKQGKLKNGYSVYPREYIMKFPGSKILAVPGSPSSFLQRGEIISGLNIGSERFTTVIHPAAVISHHAQIGYNVLIMAGVVITANAKIGNHVCILPNTVVHHDVIIGDYTLIGSNVTIAGYSKIGSNCYVGSGSSVINNIEVGDHTLIGMGSNVIHSIPENTKAVGNPARIL